jgi:lipoprotein NlpD
VRNYLPGYLPAEVRQEIIDNALRVDSLENALQIQAQYISNVRAALNGTLEVDQIRQTTDTAVGAQNIDLARSKETENFVRNYEDEEQFNINDVQASVLNERPVFCRPAKGLVSSRFNAQEKHFGIDIAASADEPVLATLRGVIVFAGFDPETGYVVQIQHQDGYLSVYKHCSRLLKKQGQAVDTGEVVALIGNTGQLSTGNHLHFEIWKNGIALNPEEILTF